MVKNPPANGGEAGSTSQHTVVVMVVCVYIYGLVFLFTKVFIELL